MSPWQCQLFSFRPFRASSSPFPCFRQLCPWLPIINTPSAPPSSLSTSTTAPAPASLRHCHEIPISSNLAATALDGAPERQLRQNTCDHQRSPHHELSHQVRIPQKSTRHWNRWKFFSLWIENLTNPTSTQTKVEHYDMWSENTIWFKLLWVSVSNVYVSDFTSWWQKLITAVSLAWNQWCLWLIFTRQPWIPKIPFSRCEWLVAG